MEKLMIDRKTAAEMLDISLPVLDGYIRREVNPIPTFKAGRRVLIPVESLRKWVNDEAQRGAVG